MAFTYSELSRCNGRNGNPAYVAFRGRVYDISHLMAQNSQWTAGIDLTDQLDMQDEVRTVLSQGIVIGGISDG